MLNITSCLKITQPQPRFCQKYSRLSQTLLIATLVLGGTLGFPGLANSANTAAILVPVNMLLLDEPGPDLVVINPSVSDSALGLGETFTIYATTKNQGSEGSEFTTLSFYASSDSNIDTGDTLLDTEQVGELTPGGTELASLATSIAEEGIYWIGACVDSVDGETNINNQCSAGVPIDVTDNVPAYAGKYCGHSNLQYTHPITQEVHKPKRLMMIDIETDDSVLVTGEDNNVAGDLSGTTVTATVPITITGENSCTGSLDLSGEVALPNINGNVVSGSVLCSGVLTILITGTFTTTKTYAGSCDLTP